MAELVDRTTIEALGGDEIVARAHQRLEGDELRRMAGGHRESRSTALEGCHPFLEYSLGRVHDAGIDVAESLQPEQRGGMVGIVENVAGGLIDRRGACTRCRIRLCAGMNGERVETWFLGHRPLP